jgi:chaperone required for assembly of F1-ATPase
LLDWAEAELGLTLVRTVGIVHQAQSAQTVARAAQLAAALDDYGLAGVAMAAGLFGSAVLAFALQRGRLDGQGAFDLSHLDETYQAEQWGVDAEAADRAAQLRADALMLEAWFVALGSGGDKETPLP